LARDQVAANLASWAATVVVLPLEEGSEVIENWLHVAFRAFPREFLAFADHVETLVLDDHVSKAI
jgi:hypothetical protein